MTVQCTLRSLSPNGQRLVTASGNTTAKVWVNCRVRGPRAHPLEATPRPSSTRLSAPKGNLIATTSTDNSARIWDATTGALVHVLSGHTNRVLSPHFSSDGARLVTGSRDGTAKVWDVAKGTLLFDLPVGSAQVDSAVFDPQGTHILTGNRAGLVRTWNASSGAPELAIQAFPAMDSRFTPRYLGDGTRIIAAGQTQAKVFAARDGGLQFACDQESDLTGLTISLDGVFIATASTKDNTVRIWDGATGQRLRMLHVPGTDGVTVLAFSQDNAQLLTATNSGKTVVWSRAAGTASLNLVAGYTDLVVAASFTLDGNWCVTGSVDGTARLWDLSKDQLLPSASTSRAGVLAAHAVAS